MRDSSPKITAMASGITLHLRLKELGQRRLRNRPRGVIKLLKKLMPLLWGKDLQPVQGHIGRLHRRLQEPHKARSHRLDCLLIEEIQAVFEPPLNAKRLSFRAQALAQARG